MQLALSNINIPADLLDRFDNLFAYFITYPTKDDWQWRLVIHSKPFHYTADTAEDEIIAALEEQLDYMLSKENAFFSSIGS